VPSNTGGSAMRLREKETGAIGGSIAPRQGVTGPFIKCCELNPSVQFLQASLVKKKCAASWPLARAIAELVFAGGRRNG
jgi:hypothetical protein